MYVLIEYVYFVLGEELFLFRVNKFYDNDFKFCREWL